jgi:hypothetical protein
MTTTYQTTAAVPMPRDNTRETTTTVQRAYLIRGTEAERVILDSQGLVFQRLTCSWSVPAGVVVTVPGTYGRWCDVPSSWVGGCPWFR